MRSLHPELLGAGRVDPTLALRGASKGTWFGNILNERVRQRSKLRSPRHAHATAEVNAAGPERHRFVAAGNRHGLRPALGRTAT